MNIDLLFFRDCQRTTKVRACPDIEREQCPVTSKFNPKGQRVQRKRIPKCSLEELILDRWASTVRSSAVGAKFLG